MPGKLNDCVCQFANVLGGAKDQATTLMSVIIGLLTALKVQIQLFNIDVEDELRKVQYQAELLAIQATINTLAPPFAMLNGYTRALADCDPVASFARCLEKVKATLLEPAYKKQFEVQQLLLALQAKSNEIAAIDRMIGTLTEFRDALDLCGTP